MPQTSFSEKIMEKPMLTRKQIETAKKDRSHIAIQTLDNLGSEYWAKFVYQYNTKANRYTDQQDLCNTAFVPFAEALEGKEFTLNPLEIVSIWSRAEELFSQMHYPKYRLSTSLALVYGTIPINSSQWKNLFKKMEGRYGYLKKLAQQEKTEAMKFRERLSELGTSLKELDFYRTGTRESFSGLVNRAIKGDSNAEQRLHEINAWSNTHDEKLLGEIHENWVNGMYGMLASLPGIEK